MKIIFYTPREIAEMLKVNYRKVLDMITLGELPAYRIGGIYRISEYELSQFLDKNKIKSPWKK
ncbi:MAG: helix-turn-helix domain-containing protein [Candidatus Marinimicrobia bacterium]|nr:helix-turn-helix domain-containing protein [Candidatus Neomarinimicrobiota bacterium]